ncbi:MAG: tyrosine-type recombinase/integrase [Bacteroidales bacterium]|nr:tyrosine-type recombinase/integrase [Bacteroidales bacterium]
MGRVKSEIPKGMFFLKARPNAQGEKPLYLRYFVNGKYAMRSCDIWLPDEDWDQKHQEVRMKNKQAKAINLKLKSIKDKVDRQILDFKGGILTRESVQQMLDGEFLSQEEKAQNINFIDFCQEVNQILYDREKFGSSVWYNNKCYINQFAKFLRKKLKIETITLAQMNLDYVNKWVKYQINDLEKTSRVGINHTITPLVNAIRYARSNGMYDYEKGVYFIENAYIQPKARDYNPDAKLPEKTKVKYLTIEQLEQLKAYEPRNNRSHATRDILDMFFFSFYSCGLRVSDIVTLEWSQIDYENKSIDKFQVKTKNKGKVAPQLSKEAFEILERWKQRPHAKTNRFVFNLLNDDFDFSDQLALKMRINACTRTINQSLNKIGENLKFPDKLSIHMARHTFCVHAISKGMSIHFISQLMGHSSIAATERTYAEFLKETIDNEMSKISDVFVK